MSEATHNALPLQQRLVIGQNLLEFRKLFTTPERQSEAVWDEHLNRIGATRKSKAVDTSKAVADRTWAAYQAVCASTYKLVMVKCLSEEDFRALSPKEQDDLRMRFVKFERVFNNPNLYSPIVYDEQMKSINAQEWPVSSMKHVKMLYCPVFKAKAEAGDSMIRVGVECTRTSSMNRRD